VLLEARYRDTGEDAYPDIREKAPAFFEKLPDLATLMRRVMNAQAGEDSKAELESPGEERRWAERGVFRVLLEKFGYLPITTDSHLGPRWTPKTGH